MEIFNREGIRIFSRNLKILLLEEGNSKIRVFVSIIEEFRKMEKLEREGDEFIIIISYTRSTFLCSGGY